MFIVNRTGDINQMLAQSKAKVEAIMAEDSFCMNKLAEFTITEFLTSQAHADLKKLLANK